MTWLCNYSNTISWRQTAALPCCQVQQSPLQSLSSLVNFQLMHFQLIVFFYLKPNFCYVQCNVFPFTTPMFNFHLCRTQPVTFHISFPVCAQIDTVQMPVKQSLLALNLPAFLPRALEMEKGRPGVTALRVHIQRNPAAVIFSLLTSTLSVQTPFSTARLSLRSEVRYYCGCFYLFISPPHAFITVTVIVHNVVWVLILNTKRIGTSYSSDLFAHFLRNLSPFSCPVTPWKESIIYSESKYLCRRRD